MEQTEKKQGAPLPAARTDSINIPTPSPSGHPSFRGGAGGEASGLEEASGSSSGVLHLLLNRKYFKPTYTIGTLGYVDTDGGYHYICDTLEPPSAHTNAISSLRYIEFKKTEGYRAVPCGTYDVRLMMSRRFGRWLPELKNVKGFRDVLIHEGNFPRDTRGCILPGWNRRQGMVCNSRSALAKVMELINKTVGSTEKVKLTIFEGGKK